MRVRPRPFASDEYGTSGIDADDHLAAVEKEIVDVVDHKNFNLDVPFMRDVIPTSENIVTAFWKILAPKVKPGKLARLVLWETENNYVEYTGK